MTDRALRPRGQAAPLTAIVLPSPGNALRLMAVAAGFGLVGPLVAGVLTVLALGGFRMLALIFDPGVAGNALLAAYVVGGPPAFATGLAVSLAGRRRSGMIWLFVWSAGVGALSALVWPALFDWFSLPDFPDVTVLATLSAASAISGTLCTLLAWQLGLLGAPRAVIRRAQHEAAVRMLVANGADLGLARSAVAAAASVAGPAAPAATLLRLARWSIDHPEGQP